MGRVAGLTPEETKRRVLDAAAKVFAESGFEGSRIAQIAKAAGLSVGAIYNHYQSKAELLAAVVERHSAAELSQLLAAEEPAGVLDLIAAQGRRLDAAPRGAPLLAEVILAARRDPDSAEILRHEVANREHLMAEFVRFGQSTGDVVTDADPDVVARFCLMLGLGSLLIQAMELPPTDSDAWASFITRLVDGFRPGENE